VPQQQLNLLKLAATGAAQLGQCQNSGCLGVGLDELPDDLLAESLARHQVGAIH